MVGTGDAQARMPRKAGFLDQRAARREHAFLTSGGLKDPETTAKHLPAIPLIEPNLDALRSALDSSYGFNV